MTLTFNTKGRLSLLRLHSSASKRNHSSLASFKAMLFSVKITPLKLGSFSSTDLIGAANTNIVRNHLKTNIKYESL